MKPSSAFEAHREEIRRIVEANRGLNPRVFGSVLHGEDTEQSDLDILIDAAPRFTLFDMARIALEIDQLTKPKSMSERRTICRRNFVAGDRRSAAYMMTAKAGRIADYVDQSLPASLK